jgi:hypothetical protein
MALGPTQPPIQWVPGASSLGVKRPGREVDHSAPSGAEVKNAWSYTSTPQYVFMAGCLVKHRNNFIFYLTFTLYVGIAVKASLSGTRVCTVYSLFRWFFVSRIKKLVQKFSTRRASKVKKSAMKLKEVDQNQSQVIEISVYISNRNLNFSGIALGYGLDDWGFESR